MKKKTILALGSLLPAEMDALEKSFDLIRLWKEPNPEAVLQAYKNDIIGILSAYNGIPVTARILESLPNLEIVAQFGVGVDNIDLSAAKARGIAVTNTPDILTPDTADIALSLILCLMRRIVEADMYVRVGKWASGAFSLSSSLSGKTVGIVGMGRIGRAIARRCLAFDMKIVYHGPRQKPDLTYPYFADLRQMAEASDVLVMACPGGPETKNLVTGKILKALGPKGYLVNIARGSVVNTEDLLIALRNRDIAGVGLDVYENEPNVPEALISMDNVVLLPHVGSATAETRSEMGRLVIANILAYFEGKPLLTAVEL
ncbi:MAG: 2-hydroxyacid dehydrogenase [Alphaproteobacteria bacterium]|jgi:hydroxypyruvate reductase|nr:2-hydroxyacid dehydrogenase [Alphaproteobacteria bacterium]MBP9867974.1 2-hydroxyacid dehydrogenase [Alphaproteobacteria bacterium]